MNKLFNPIKYFEDKKLLTFNLFIFCVGTLLTVFLKVRFDGVFDIHFVSFKTPVKTLTDNITNIIILTIILFIVGKIINSKTRLIDCLNTAFLSRIPYYILSISNISGFISRFSNDIKSAVLSGNLDFTIPKYLILLFISLTSIIAIIAMIVIIFNGFKIAVNPKKMKHYVYFFVGLFIAEIISSMLLKNI